MVLLILAGLLVGGCELISLEEKPSAEVKPLAAELPASGPEVLDATDRFSWKLARELQKADPDENLFFSPLSISIALGMTMNGAGGETKDEMKKTLGFEGQSLSRVNEVYRALIMTLPTVDPKVELSLAQAIFYDERYPFRQAFLDTNRKHFDAEIKPKDFRNPGQVVDEINRWVRTQTEGTIEKLVKQLNPNEVMALLNAIYFFGSWKYPFDKADTKPGSFTRPDGSTGEVPFMSHSRRLPLNKTERATLIELPYGDSLFTMTAVLPDTNHTVADLVQSVDEALWQEWLAGLDVRKIWLDFPKFELRDAKRLNNVLRALGMESAFSADKANFKPMVEGQKENSLHITSVRHKASIRINEEGTEASAATSVKIGFISTPPVVKFNRPFLFVIRETTTGAILFVGQVTDPTV